MILRHNHVQDFSVGIRVNPLNPLGSPGKSPLWMVADNVASVIVSNDNTPVPIVDQKARVQQSNNRA